jgi:large subunit ribosomal protein L25
MTITLTANSRAKENPMALKKEEKIPAVYYGAGKPAVSISIPMKAFAKVWKEAGETTTVTLDLGKEKVPTLIHDIQRDAITGEPTHVDFLVIDMNKEIEVHIPLEFTGLAEAEKGGLGTLVKAMHEVEVRALPGNLPHSFTVDVTRLATLEDQIHAGDIELPKGVTLVTDPKETIALVAAYKEEKEEAPTAIDFDSIKVEEKGKKEEEEIPAE